MNDRNREATLGWAPSFLAVRKRTESLITGLSPEDCALQSMPDASPLKWHLAHTTWFWETFVLANVVLAYKPFDPAFRYLFNSYYNTVGEQFPRPQRGLLSRPDLETVLRYRAHVDAALHTVLVQFDEGRISLPADLEATVVLGLNHEEQHQELMLTDVLHLLDINPLRPVFGPDAPRPGYKGSHRSEANRANAATDLVSARSGLQRAQWQEFTGGLVEIGHDGVGFCFDNELPRHQVWLAPFEINGGLVTNSQYRAFIDADGYQRPEFWLSEGFDVASMSGWRAPLYWQQQKNGWSEFSLGGEQALDDDAPVSHLSYYEADAFARFAGARLPTEFEWEHAVTNADAHAYDKQPALPLADIEGSVWQWTSSSYAAYPGFTAAANAIGEYNGKFMVNQYVLRGGSCATPPGHTRRTYRNFFPAAARWQFAGLRLARSVTA